MECLATLASGFVLLVLALFISGALRVPSAVAPLVAVCFTMLYFSVWGCVDGLFLGGILYFVLAAAALVALIVKKTWRPKCSIGLVLFTVLSLCIILLFAVRKPLFMEWDEFSFWGTAVKMTKLENLLYTKVNIGWEWAATQKPGLVVFGYFFNFLGSFAEWRVCAAYDVLAFSALAAMTAPFTKKQWYIAVPLAGAVFLSPYIFTIYRVATTPSNVYMNAHSDVPMAWLFLGCFVVFYALRQNGARLWPVLLCLGALTMTRDTALPLALIAAVILSADLLFCGKECSFAKWKGKVAKWLHIVCMLAVPVVCFVWWVLYLKTALQVDPLGNVGGTEEMGMVTMLLLGMQMFFGINPSEKYTYLMGMMYDSFASVRLSMLGSGLALTVVTLGITVLAALLSHEKLHRVRCLIYGVLSTLGFAAFYIFTGFCFVFIFKYNDLTGYERYLYPYYLAWFLGALFLLACTAAQKGQHLYGAATAGIILTLAVFGVRVWQFVPPDMTFIGCHDSYLYYRRSSMQTAQNVKDLIGDETNGSIFYIAQGDNGSGWFTYCSELLPLQLDYSFGGGTLTVPGAEDGDAMYRIEMTPDELCAYLQDKHCGYVFVQRSDDVLKTHYASLFSDSLAACENGAALYRVETTGTQTHLVLAGEVEA